MKKLCIPLILWLCLAATVCYSLTPYEKLEQLLAGLPALKTRIAEAKSTLSRAASKYQSFVTDKELAAAQKLLMASYEEALTLTEQLYAPEAPAAPARLDENLGGESAGSLEGEMWLGSRAFNAAPWLLSIRLHEQAHRSQAARKCWYNDVQGSNMQELEAYDLELARAEETRLSPADREEITKRRAFHYNALTDLNKAQADKKDYRLILTLEEALAAKIVTPQWKEKGVTAGEIFTLTLTRGPLTPVKILIPSGTLFVPKEAQAQIRISDQDYTLDLWDKESGEQVINGYCLEYQKPYLAAGTEGDHYWVTDNGTPDPSLQERLSGLLPYLPECLRIITTGQECTDSGKFHYDLGNNQNRIVIQYCLWSAIPTPDAPTFETLKARMAEELSKQGITPSPESLERVLRHLQEDFNLLQKP